MRNMLQRFGLLLFIPSPVEQVAAYDYNDVMKAPAAVMTRIAAAIHPGPIELKPSPFIFGAGLALVF